MREIKFRAWDEDNKCWYHSPQLVIRPYSGKVTDGATTPNIVLLQFTGLKDKNGKEIYEGDILGMSGSEKYAYIIEWNCSNGCFTSINGGTNNFIGDVDDEISFNILSNMRLDICEVIGNIYENPELLELR